MSNLPVPSNEPFVGPGQGIASRPSPVVTVPDAAALLEAFRRRWPLALGGGVVMALIMAALAWYVVPAAKYRAVGTLRVSMVRPKILFNTAEQEAEYQTFQKTQSALIRSRLVLDAVVRDAEVAALPTLKEISARQGDPSEWLEKELSVEFANRSEILQISMTGDRPEDVGKITNKVIDMYMKMVIDSDGDDRNKRVETLRKLWDRYQENLKTKRNSLRQLALAVGSDDKQTLSMKGQLAHEQLALAENERMRTRSELSRLQAEITVLAAEREREASGAPNVETDLDRMVEEQLERDEYIGELKSYVNKVSQTYEAARRIAKDDNDPSIASARNKIETARKSMATRREQLRPVLARRLREAMRPGFSSSPENLDKKAEILKQFDRDLAADVERLKGEIRSLNENTLDLQTEQDQIALLSETAKKVGAEVEAMDVELQAPKRIEVIDRAKTPGAKDDLKKAKASGMAALGAFAFVMLCVTLSEARTMRISKPDQIETLGIRLVGALPSLQGRGRSTPALRKSKGLLIESVDAMRTMLLHASRMESIRVVMVTSGVAGEGKSSLSCHLAASLARSGRKTLLIDGDLRKPSVHRLFDQPIGPGLSDLLRGEAHLSEVIHPSQSPDLDLITAGRSDQSTVQALARGDLQSIFDLFRERYDFVIIDSAPVLPVVDSLLIAQHVDAVLFSILRDVSRLPSVQEAHGRLTALGIRVLGAVVSGVKADSYGSHYSASRPGEAGPNESDAKVLS